MASYFVSDRTGSLPSRPEGAGSRQTSFVLKVFAVTLLVTFIAGWYSGINYDCENVAEDGTCQHARLLGTGGMNRGSRGAAGFAGELTPISGRSAAVAAAAAESGVHAPAGLGAPGGSSDEKNIYSTGAYNRGRDDERLVSYQMQTTPAREARRANASRRQQVSPEVRKWRETHWPGMQCPDEGSVVFYKTHKTGSTTLSNLLYRYSILHRRSVFSPEGARCQHYETCLPEHGGQPLTKERAFDMALHHYHAVGDREGTPEASGKWHDKIERYKLAAKTQPVQLVSIVREPLAAFFSKFDYFDLRRKVGTIKEAMQNPAHTEGQTRDFGIYNDEQLEEFLKNDFQPAFFFVLEELALSLALLKLACNMAWHDVVVRQSNKAVRGQGSKAAAKRKAREALVAEHHRRDYVLYNASLRKLFEAKADYPNQGELAATADRIRSTNLAADAKCELDKKSAFCTLLNLQPLKFAENLDPTTNMVEDVHGKPWTRLGGVTVGAVLAEIRTLAELPDT